MVPLHLHSFWSLLNGVCSVEELVAEAASRAISALALTDTAALYGMPEFIRLCGKNSIRPIIGAELRYDGGDIQLLVSTEEGYRNLCSIITAVQGNVDRTDALARGVSTDMLTRHAEGLILLTGGIEGPIDRYVRRGDMTAADAVLKRLIAIFGTSRTFVSLEIRTEDDSTHARTLNALARGHGVVPAATHDIHYCNASQAEKLHVLRAMRSLTTIHDTPYPSGLHFPTDEEMRIKFGWNMDAIPAAETIAELCEYVPVLGTFHFPRLGTDANEVLRQEAYAGAGRTYGAISDTVRARIEKELAVITTAGYADYFLIVADIVRYARSEGIPFSPRGSGSSSLVSYCIGIHDVDPFYYDLYFERFLSLERLDPPDIDIDFSSDRRDEVILYVYRKYGADRVAMVCTHLHLQPRSAFHETAKVFGIPEKRIRELSRHIPMFYFHERPESRDSKRKRSIIDHAQNDTERKAIAMAKSLEGIPHHLSVHPGGIVISPEPLSHFVPLQYARKGILTTQFDLTGVSAIGLVKIDLLGVSSLTVASRTIRMIQQLRPDLTLASIPLDDERTSAMIMRAETIGIFQIESPGLRLTLREIQARTKDDIIRAICLYRPGPLKGGLKDAFIRRHHGKEDPAYLHPSLAAILRETYGVILYQEQVIRIAHEVGGFSLGRADMLRKAISRFTHAHLIQGMQEEFIRGAFAQHGIDADTAEKIWKLMAAFAGYGFPKAHAAAYGELAYKMAYLKAHYPAEYMASRLAVPGGYYSENFYRAEARRLGITLRGPHVNVSGGVCTLESGELWAGLSMLRDLTKKTLRRIVKRQPFASFDDFLARARPLFKETQHLLRAGCLDGLAPYGEMKDYLDNYRWTGEHIAQKSLTLDIIRQGTDDRTPSERMKEEHHVLGCSFTHHFLDLIPVNGHIIVRGISIPDHYGEKIYLYGIPRAWHTVTTAGGKWKMLVDMEDQSGIFQMLCVRPKKGPFARNSLLLVHGTVKRTSALSYIVVADAVEELERR